MVNARIKEAIALVYAGWMQSLVGLALQQAIK